MTPVKLKIKDLGKVMTGKTPDTSKRRYYDGSYRFVTPSDIDYRNYYCRKTETTVTNEAEQKFRNQFIPKDSTMFVCIGNTIGKCALSDQKCMTNQQINSIIPSNIEHGKFIYYLMVNNVEIVRGVGIGGGVASPIINKTKFENLSISAPIKDKWIEIGQFLSLYDDLIETNLRRIQLLEETTRLLFREWFVYFRFPGFEKAKFVDHDGIQIPAGWDYLPITKVKIFKKTRVGVPVFIDTRRYYQTSEIDGTNLVGSGEEVDYENRPSRADVAPRLNSVYFAKMKDTDKVVYFNKGNAELLERILLSTGMAGFSTDKKYLAFLFGLLTSCKFVQNKNNYATGATQVSLSDGGLKKIKVILPKLELIEKYSSIINPFLEECSYLRNQNQKLAQARDLLLPRLMSGKIDVSKIDIKVVQEA